MLHQTRGGIEQRLRRVPQDGPCWRGVSGGVERLVTLPHGERVKESRAIRGRPAR